jgi:hypothetical protein
MPLSSSSVDRRFPEALSTSRGKPAGASDGNIQKPPAGISVLGNAAFEVAQYTRDRY